MPINTPYLAFKIKSVHACDSSSGRGHQLSSLYHKPTEKTGSRQYTITVLHIHAYIHTMYSLFGYPPPTPKSAYTYIPCTVPLVTPHPPPSQHTRTYHVQYLWLPPTHPQVSIHVHTMYSTFGYPPPTPKSAYTYIPCTVTLVIPHPPPSLRNYDIRMYILYVCTYMCG